MDNYVHCLQTLEEAFKAIKRTKNSLNESGFRLTKFASKEEEAIIFIRPEDELKEIKKSAQSEKENRNWLFSNEDIRKIFPNCKEILTGENF